MSLLIGAWFKPSFYVGFSVVAFIVLVFGFIRDEKRWNNLRFYLAVGFSFLPTIPIILMQYKKLYMSERKAEVHIRYTVENVDIAQLGLKLFCFWLLPTFILIYNRKTIVKEYKKGSRLTVHAIMLWIVEFAIEQVFSEGTKINNFNWGVQIACFFVMVVTLRLFFNNVSEFICNSNKTRKRAKKLYITTAGGLLIIQFTLGIYYYIWILMGNTPFI